MKVDFLSQAGKLLKEQKQYRRRAVVFLCLAVIVTFGTVTALKLYGQAMTHKMEVLDCQYEAHEHTEDCYEKDGEGSPVGEPVCGYADYVVHMHNDRCYGTDGKLVCSLEQREPHEHTEECCVKETVLVCGHDDAGDAGETAGSAENIAGSRENVDEAAAGSVGNADGASGTGNADGTAALENGEGILDQEPACGMKDHKHTEECYKKMPACGYEVEHVHDGNCITQELVCQSGDHTHTDACHDAEGNVVCEMKEHQHIAGCYNGKGEIVCGRENHVHGEGCYDTDGNMVCGTQEHTHIVGCYQEAYTCGKEEHIHEEGCYADTLICEIGEHKHTGICYGQTDRGTAEGGTEITVSEEPRDKAASGSAETDPLSGAADQTGKGTTGLPGEGTADRPGDVKAHVHTDACYQEVTRVVCGELELHTHDDSCYDAECFDGEGNLIEGSRPSCGLPQLEEHVHQGDCFTEVELTPEEVAALNNGAKLHIHEESCYDGEGNLVCGHDATHIHSLECYDEAGKLICDYGKQEETVYVCGKEEHTHGEACYNQEENLTCEQEEHTHDETCLEEQETVYYCGKEEHEHSDECLDEGGGLSCELEEHTHNAVCLVEDPVFYCEKEEHTHGKECRDGEGNLICEKEEHTHDETCLEEPEAVYYCGKEEHTHGEACHDEDGNLICELEEHVHNGICLVEEPVFYCGKEEHRHSESCYDEAGNLICELEEHKHDEGCLEEPVYYCGKEAHTHSESCHDETGSLTCELQEHVHNAVCLIEDPFFYCGLEEHIHGVTCYDAEGNLTCELEEHEHDESCLIPGIKLIAETEDYFITLEASADAFPDVEGELTLEAVKLAEDSPEHETASQMVEEKLEQDRLEKEEAGTDNDEESSAFPFDISIAGEDGEVIPVQMPGEKIWEQKIFDIRVLANGVEVQPVMPVRVCFIRKTTEDTGATISEEKANGGESESSLSTQEEKTDDGKMIGGTDSDEEVRIFHVDPEKDLVEDMKAEKDEEGNATIDTPHFSEYSVVTVKSIEDGSVKVVQIPAEKTPWQSLAMLFYDGALNGYAIELCLQGDLVVENLDDNGNPIDAKPIWIDHNRKLILDLNGHKIISGNSSIDQKDNMAWFRVSNSGGTGELIIRDSTSETIVYETIDKKTDGPLQVVPEYNHETWDQGYHGEYNSDTQTAVYYLTESDRPLSAGADQLSGISATTTENTYKHEISFQGIGAIENKGREDLAAFIWIGDGGKVTIESGRLTNLYGSAIVSPDGGTDKEVTINGGYLVGNGQRTARDWGGAVFVDGDGDITIGEKAVLIVNKSNSEGGGIHLDSKGNRPSVLIKKGCIISSNETTGRGGGVNVKGVNLTVEGGCITNNFAGSGGGLSVDGEFVIKDVVIAGNAVSGGGGGIYVGTAESGVIEGGVIAGNRARAEGGGIRLESGHVALAATENSLLYITNNKTISDTGTSYDWGGGGIFISEGNGQMTIYDAVVTQNEAKGFGGGVSGCSTGRLSIEETRGAAVYGNTAVGGNPVGDRIDGLSGGGSSKHDDHDAYISEVFNAKNANGSYKKDFQDIFSALSSIVGPTMLGGGAVNWTGSCDYAFVENNSQEIISTKLLGLTAHPETDAVSAARNLARVFISGNYSGTHGGGIMCNGLIVLGNKSQILYNESLTIDFPKAYHGVDGSNKQPTDGQFEFELLDKEGNQLAVYSTTANPNTSGTNVLGVLGINFKKDGSLPAIEGTDPVDVSGGDGAIGRHTYYLKEIIPTEQGFMKYDETVYKIEFDVKCKGRKITLGKNCEVTQYWLYVDWNNTKVSIVDKIGTEGSEVPGATVVYEFSSIGDYNGNTQHKGGHLSIREKSLPIGEGQSTTSKAFVNEDKVQTLSLKILKTNDLQVKQGKPGYMSCVSFQLTALTDEGRKEEGNTAGGNTNDNGELEFPSIPNVRGKYLLEETVPEGFEEAGPWIVETDGKENLYVYAVEGKEVTETINGVENTYWVYEKNSSDKVTVETQKGDDGSVKLLINIVNIPILYSLPETGGTGLTLYTMAGAMFLVFGAGFLYRKKFGERRAKNL